MLGTDRNQCENAASDRDLKIYALDWSVWEGCRLAFITKTKLSLQPSSGPLPNGGQNPNFIFLPHLHGISALSVSIVGRDMNVLVSGGASDFLS